MIIFPDVADKAALDCYAFRPTHAVVERLCSCDLDQLDSQIPAYKALRILHLCMVQLQLQKASLHRSSCSH